MRKALVKQVKQNAVFVVAAGVTTTVLYIQGLHGLANVVDSIIIGIILERGTRP